MYRLLPAILRLLPLVAAALVAAAVPAVAADQPPLVLAGDSASFPLRGHLARLDDPQGTLQIAEAAAAAFEPRPAGTVERNYTRGAVWYRFTAVREAALPEHWVFAVGEPFIDDIRVYTAGAGGGFDEIHLGRRFPNGALPMAARLHVMALDLPAEQPKTVYVRLASHDEIQFEAALWRPDALLFAEVRQSTLLGMFFAVLAIVVGIYVLFGVSLRDPPMLAYSLYLFTFILFGASHSGIMAVLFPSLGGRLVNLLTGAGVLGNLAALTFMWASVLNLRRTAPRLHRYYLLFGAATLAFFLAIPGPWYILLVRPTFIATMLVTAVSLGLAAIRLHRGQGSRLLTCYVAAFIPFLLFSVGHAAEAFFPSRIDILLVRQFGTLAILAHIAILTVALAQRIALLQRERLRADAELAATRSSIREHRNFVSTLSHQVRNPLAVITTTLDVLERKACRNADTDKIRRAAMRIRDLADDLLADSRLEEMSATMRVQPVELTELLKGVCEEFHDGRERIRFDRRERVVVAGDPTLLEILFANLLDNARKYSAPAGEIRVTLAGGGLGAVVSIADEGPGIPAAEVEKVFEKYYRSAATSAQPGTGLGLFLVRRIAERHGGRVSLRTAPGEGADFVVELPAGQVEALNSKNSE